MVIRMVASKPLPAVIVKATGPEAGHCSALKPQADSHGSKKNVTVVLSSRPALTDKGLETVQSLIGYHHSLVTFCHTRPSSWLSHSQPRLCKFICDRIGEKIGSLSIALSSESESESKRQNVHHDWFDFTIFALLLSNLVPVSYTN